MTNKAILNEPHELLDVTVVTGDDYCRTHEISHIDFLKIDVEGAEPLVLQGFGDMLSNKRIDFIQFEYGMANIYTRFLLQDYYEMFSSLGYVVGKLYPAGLDFKKYEPHQEDFRGPNFVACLDRRCDLIDLMALRT